MGTKWEGCHYMNEIIQQLKQRKSVRVFEDREISEEIIRGYYGEIQDFLECMLEGREPLSGFQIAREAAELTQIAYLAAEQNRTVVL